MGNRSLKTPLVAFAMILLVVLLGWDEPIFALDSAPAANQYVHDSWTTEDGLPQNSVNAIVQTRDGYLWLGTFGGLARFDGVKFTVFDAGNTPGLKDNRITSLYEDHEGHLWIATEYGQLTRYWQGQFVTYTTNDGWPGEPIRSMSEDQDGALVVITTKGSVRLSAGRFAPYAPPFDVPGDASLWRVARDVSVWLVSNESITRVRKGVRTTYKSPRGIIEPILDIFEARDGSAWLATLFELVRFQVDTATTVATVAGTAGPPLPDLMVFKVYEDQTGATRFLTPRGLARFQDGKLMVEPIAGLSRVIDRVTKVTTRSVTIDREGSLWIGTTGDGLHRFRRTPLTAYAAEQGLSDQSFLPITEDGEGGLWLGADTCGLFRFQGGTFTSITRQFCPWALCRTRDGTLWVGDYGGLHRFKNGQFTTYNAPNSPPKDLLVASLYEDRAGALWIGVGRGPNGEGGLYRLKDGVFTPYRAAEGLVGNDVRFIAEDRQGALWIGTTGGLSRFKDGQFTNYTTDDGLSHNYVRAVHEDADGTFWIGTYGGGLNRFKNGRFVPITTRDGLFDNVVSRILEDDRGNFWMSGNKGIFRASRKDLADFADGKTRSIVCFSYGVADGMKSSECNGGGQPAGWKTRDGKLWFPTIKGVVVIDPNRINPLPPPVVIERVLVDGAPADVRPRIEMPPGRGDLEIHYAGLSFLAPEKIRFKYTLEGYDDGWTEAQARRVAYYTKISPGTYRFRVIACNNDGIWNETGATFEFSLRPHFYQTNWFYALSVLGLLLVAVGVYRLRVRQLVRRTQELEAKVAERTAELVEQKNELAQAKDGLEQANVQLEQANDDLLSILNELRLGVAMTDEQGTIMFLSEAAQQFLGKTQEEVVGRSWEQLLPLQDQDRAQLRAVAALPLERRAKIPVQIQAGGRRYWMEIEIDDDPRDARRKMFFLYDVTEIYDLRRLLHEKTRFYDLVGESTVMQLVYQQIQDVAWVDTTVLIEGETGTGKELVARGIHQASPRKNKSFIAVNCAGLTESLLASQLFGHKRGAFTGAVADQVGLLEAATGGTLFLDEIGDMPMNIQTSLLRVLQEKEITRLGESAPRKIDVRVIAATNRDLHQEVAAGRFRQDLLYRIRVTRIQLPPLRQRREDIPLLVAWFLSQFQAAEEKSVQEVSQETMQALLAYDWPGNVRELKSAIESAVLRCQGPVIQVQDLSPEVTGSTPSLISPAHPSDEKQRILDALKQAGGNRAAAARLLGVSRRTFYRRLESLGISPDEI
jgi:PAS domain S-box-containing protein